MNKDKANKTNKTVGGLVDAINNYRKNNPVRVPFPSGTPTLQAQASALEQALGEAKLAETQKQNEIKNAIESEKLRISNERLNLSKEKAKKGSSGSGSGGSSSGGKTTATQRKNAILNQLVPGIQERKAKKVPQEEVKRKLIKNIGQFGPDISPSDINKLVKSVYGNYYGEYKDNTKPSGSNKGTMSDDIAKKALKSRPWRQKIIDAVLPGKQYR